MTATGTGRREATKAANRAAILEAARDVFGQLGFEAASVRDIVRRTGLAAGTFYNYFPDKESIFRAVVDETADEARLRVRLARRRASTSRAFVEDAYRAYFKFIVEDPRRVALLNRNAGTLRALFGEGQMPLGAAELEADLREAVADGRLPMAGVDLDYAAHAMVATGVELGMRLIERDPPDVEGATTFATTLFLSGLEALAHGAHGADARP